MLPQLVMIIIQQGTNIYTNIPVQKLGKSASSINTVHSGVSYVLPLDGTYGTHIHSLSKQMMYL